MQTKTHHLPIKVIFSRELIRQKDGTREFEERVYVERDKDFIQKKQNGFSDETRNFLCGASICLVLTIALILIKKYL